MISCGNKKGKKLFMTDLVHGQLLVRLAGQPTKE